MCNGVCITVSQYTLSMTLPDDLSEHGGQCVVKEILSTCPCSVCI